MHNVMILTSMLFGGGAERVIANLAKHLDRSRFRVTIAHLKQRGQIGEQLATDGYDVLAVSHANRGIARYFSYRSLSRVVRERRIELIHSHTTYSLVDGALCRLAQCGAVKLIHTFHFGNYPHYPRRYVIMERLASKLANHCVAVGTEQLRVIESLYRPRPGRMSVIVNGTDTAAVPVDAEWRERLERDGRVVIGTTATFIEQKGLDYLLQVARILQAERANAVFVITGDGLLRREIEERCRQMGLQQSVLFAGWKADADATMMPLYDVLLQPSLWEAMSIVVLEAMAAAKPVVVTSVGDNAHVVRDGQTGFVVSPRDVTAMANRLQQLISSRALRREFGEAGRRRHDALYTAAAMARRYEDLYECVLNGVTVPREAAEGNLASPPFPTV